MKTNKPFLIGVCGNSGSGKSGFVQLLVDLLGEKNVLVIHGDDYHKWQRGDEEWTRYTHLNPAANNLLLAKEHLSDLKNGNAVYKVEYGHDTGKFIGPYKVQARKYIIFEGLHVFIPKGLRDKFDFKIFIDVDKKLNAHFKIHRDIAERGYTREKIVKAINSREKDAEKYIYPQKQFADLIIKKTPLHDLDESKREVAVDYTFIHRKTINANPLARIFKKLFKDKVTCEYNKNNYTVRTASVLKEDELKSLKKTAKKEFGINLTDNVFSLVQLIAAYNICAYGSKVGKLKYPHRGKIGKSTTVPKCKKVNGVLKCSLKPRG